MASAGRWGGAPQGQALGIQADLLPMPLCPLPHLPPALSQCLAPAPSPRSWHPPLSVTPEGTASVCCLLPPLSPHPPPLPRDPPKPLSLPAEGQTALLYTQTPRNAAPSPKAQLKALRAHAWTPGPTAGEVVHGAICQNRQASLIPESPAPWLGQHRVFNKCLIATIKDRLGTTGDFHSGT